MDIDFESKKVYKDKNSVMQKGKSDFDDENLLSYVY